MTADEITAAQSAVVSAFEMITDLIGGNITAIFTVATVVAIVGILGFLIRGLFGAVGIRNIP